MEFADIRGEVKLNEPLSKHTSFCIGGPADILAYPADRNDLMSLLREAKKRNLNYFILGGGTNLLVRDGGFRGVVINVQRMNAIRVEREYHAVGGTFITVFAEAGAALAKLLSFAAEEGFTGLEFAVGIPGTLGGALCMNAGTAEGEIGDIVDSVTMISPEGEVITKGREQMEFGYRTARIPAGQVIVDAKIILRRGDKIKVTTRVKELMDTRKQRQPWGQPSAGSAFKNPQDESAGKLIESAGLKGKTIGGAQVSDKHANFIVNTGHAKAADVLALMEIIKNAVLEHRGVRLEPEIKIIGED
ncbi:MAG: UDP-N-acetylenolpyruvoylglucosamine reductase [Nitrospirae bacterium RBG_19FT_COMBO_55_12]|nr:MAG: UDP-N-acetylenolpyruvoylglucosamine reductase [Nitrospirae bacterium RBG_19FT_COMBO_55_12]